MKRFSIILLFAVLLLSGCNQYKDVRIESVKVTSVNFKKTTSATVELDVLADNPTKRTLSLPVFEGMLMKEDKEFATFQLSNEPSLAPETEGHFAVKIDLSISDPISLLTVGLNILSWSVDDFKLNGKVTIQSSTGGRKSFKFKNMPLSKVIKTFR